MKILILELLVFTFESFGFDFEDRNGFSSCQFNRDFVRANRLGRFIWPIRSLFGSKQYRRVTHKNGTLGLELEQIRV